jgi:HSP20 family protein
MLTAWNAMSALDRMFDDVMGSAFGTATSPRTFDPDVDIRASEDEVVFECDVPGLKDEDLEVTLENHVLTIKGKRRFDTKANEQVILGRTYGAFRRSFQLPDYLDEANLQAALADGVLTIRIPKHPQAKPRKIAIGSGPAPKQLKE